MGKIQISSQLSDDTLNKISSLQALEPQQSLSRNQVIEAAINFYFSYKTSELNQAYLCSVIGQKIDGMISKSNDRISKLTFKEAVEINMLTRLIASHFDIDKLTYEKMRKSAVDDVKSSKGIINIYEAQN